MIRKIGLIILAVTLSVPAQTGGPESGAVLLSAGTNATLSFEKDQAGGTSGLAPKKVQTEQQAENIGRLEFRSGNNRLDRAFRWAKKQALDYVRVGDPVGEWYEAALPGRFAFCMRDVSHQASGANALGLAAFNRNMFRRFAENISEAKDWCTYWEINRDNKPAPVDYRSDKEFWYNLPANFDVLDAIGREFAWTGDGVYLEDPVFLNFYEKTLGPYVDRWDLGLDRVMTRQAQMNLAVPPDPKDPYRASRGLPSYDEGETAELNVGADLLAAQYAAYRTYAAILQAKGDAAGSRLWTHRAADLKDFFLRIWWDEKSGAYQTLHYENGRFEPGPLQEFLLYFGITAPGRPTERTLDGLAAVKEINIEARSYFPEIFYRYGRPEAAYQNILQLSDEKTPRREYPEVSFALIGAMTRGLMGIEPQALGNEVATLARLSSSVGWAEMQHVPVLRTVIDVKHIGPGETEFTNTGQAPIVWKACFAGEHRSVFVGGRRVPGERQKTEGGGPVSFVRVTVPPGQSLTARVQ